VVRRRGKVDLVDRVLGKLQEREPLAFVTKISWSPSRLGEERTRAPSEGPPGAMLREWLLVSLSSPVAAQSAV
jgi:hypothetical protein